MKKLKIHPTAFLILCFPLLRILSWSEIGILWLSAVLHELGHVIAYRICGTGMESITLLPFGLCAIPKDSIKVSPENEVFCAAAGPAVNLLLSLILLALPLSPTRGWILYALYCNISLFLINLLPILPLDGGRILYFSSARKRSPPECETVCRTWGTVLLCVLLIPATYMLIWDKNPSLAMIWGYLALYHRINRGSL